MKREDFFSRDLLTTLPSLRAFARSLGATADRADDLVQETLIKAWANQASFVPGTNLKTWLFTILRNTAYSDYRKRWREVEDADGSYAAGLVTQSVSIDDTPGAARGRILGRIVFESNNRIQFLELRPKHGKTETVYTVEEEIP